MGGVDGVYVGDAVVVADPLVSVVVGPHAVVEHPASFLDELREVAARPEVLGVVAHVAHQQDYPFAEDCALDGRVPVVQQVPLVLLYRLLYPVLKDLARGRVLQAERALYRFARVLQLGRGKTVAVAG